MAHGKRLLTIRTNVQAQGAPLCAFCRCKACVRPNGDPAPVVVIYSHRTYMVCLAPKEEGQTLNSSQGLELPQKR